MELLIQWRKIADEAVKNTALPASECLTPWDVQSRRIFDENGVWPALYSGDGGGHGYVSTAFSCNQRLSDKSDKRCNVLKSDCSLNIEKPP